MSAQPDKDDFSRQDGNSSVPFDPANYARPPAKDTPPEAENNDSAPDSLSGDEESCTSRPRWIQFVRTNWQKILAWAFLSLVVGKSVFVICDGPGWDGDNIPQAILLVYLLAELFFSDSICASVSSCILLTDFSLFETFTHHTWPYYSLFQITMAEIGLLIILLKERYFPLKVVNVPILGLHFVFFVFKLAAL